MPKSPVWEAEVGLCRVEEYHTNARATHYEIRVASGHPLTIYPHEIARLRALLDRIEAHIARPALTLKERRKA